MADDRDPVACFDPASCVRPLAARPWRVIEGQHLVATRKLVDSDDEQQVLEEIIDGAKPPAPPDTAGLHYLLATPFRYPPLPYGSRFSTRAERGLWYGAEALRTAFCECAYYRLLFLAGTTANLAPWMVDVSVFQAAVRTTRGVDLTDAPFSAARDAIAAPDRYDRTQALGRALRDSGVQAIRYPSARDRAGGVNLAVLTPAAFARVRPSPPQTWHCVTTLDYVEFARRAPFPRDSFRFAARDFLVGGKLPLPAA